MSNPIYLRSSFENGKERFRAVANQTYQEDKKTEKVSTSRNIVSVALREHTAPVGSVFVLTGGITLMGSFYKPIFEGQVACVASPNKDAIDASQEQIDAYMTFISRSASFIVKDDDEEVPEVPHKVVTTLDMLMAKNPVPDPSVAKFYVDKDTWYQLLMRTKLRKNTMLIGPTGSGKTEILEHITKSFSRVLSAFDMGTMQDAVSGLVGTHRLKGGQSVFDPSRFSKAIQVKGANILLDEINRSPQAANNILFPVLDYRRCLYMDVADSEDERIIKMHDSVAIFATANVGMEYSGTGEIDRALKDRFDLVELDYMPKEIEANMLVIRHEIDKRSAGVIADVATQIRLLAKKGLLSTGVSTRHTLGAAEFHSHGYDLKKAIESLFLPLFDDSLGMDSERNKVKQIITSK